MSQLSKLKEKSPEMLSNPDIVQLAEQADVMHDFKVLYDSEGGKQLVRQLLRDAISSVHRLRGSYQTASHSELQAIIASIDSQITTADLLLNAKEVTAVLNAELEEALRE